MQFAICMVLIHSHKVVTIAGDGLQNSAYVQHLKTLRNERHLSCHTSCDTGIRSLMAYS